MLYREIQMSHKSPVNADRPKDFVMTKTVKTAWTTPALRKLGTIADVANAQTPSAQAAGNVKS